MRLLHFFSYVFGTAVAVTSVECLMMFDYKWLECIVLKILVSLQTVTELHTWKSIVLLSGWFIGIWVVIMPTCINNVTKTCSKWVLIFLMQNNLPGCFQVKSHVVKSHDIYHLRTLAVFCLFGILSVFVLDFDDLRNWQFVQPVVMVRMQMWIYLSLDSCLVLKICAKFLSKRWLCPCVLTVVADESAATSVM